MHGSGNDFAVIDNREGIVPEESFRAWTRAICRRRLGIGADGVILIEQPTAEIPDVDFHWRYINADGSDGELCGNGAMCGARFAVHSGLAPRQCRFSTMSGVVTAEVVADRADPRVTIDLVDSSPLVRDVPVTLDGMTHCFDAVTVGVPHAVAVVDDADAFGDAALFHSYGRAVRQHEAFAPAGTNVNVIHRVDERTIRMRTYERGVEAETLACGTGAAASAFVAVTRGPVSQPVSVLTSSGQPIEVTFSIDGDRARSIRITGEARFVAHGVLEPEGWD
jgi:diaminopimelate epimerase